MMERATRDSRRSKYCFVPGCKNTGINSKKVFLSLPENEGRKQMWFEAAGRIKLASKSKFYCCEDHFNLEEDVDNYMRYKMMGGNIILKQDVVPHIFHCHQMNGKSTGSMIAVTSKKLMKQLTREPSISQRFEQDLSQNYLPLSSDHNYCSLSFYNFVAVKEDQLETTASASSTSSSATLLHHIKTEEEDPLNLDEKPTFEDMESHLCDIPIKIERDNFEDVIRRDEEFDESAPGPSGIHCFSIKNEIIEEPWQCCEGNADPEFETVFCDTVKLEVELGDVVIKSDVDS